MKIEQLPGGVVYDLDETRRLSKPDAVVLEAIHRQLGGGAPVDLSTYATRAYAEQVAASAAAQAAASASSPFIVSGPGRPDQVATTGGAVKGSEPVGATYYSSDGAGVGAWAWRKRATGWVVVDGDTGWRKLVRTDSWTDSTAYYLLRRIGDRVEFVTNALNVTASTASWPVVWGWSAHTGFRPNPATGRGLTCLSNDVVAVVNTDSNQMVTPAHLNAGKRLEARLTVLTSDPWPATLPGTAV